MYRGGRSACSRDLTLDYLGNQMDDASDNSWDSAKATHAILQTWRKIGYCSSHCSIAVADHDTSRAVYSTRYVYNKNL